MPTIKKRKIYLDGFGALHFRNGDRVTIEHTAGAKTISGIFHKHKEGDYVLVDSEEETP